MNEIGDLNAKNILFLQGPMGTFFRRVSRVFRKKGARTFTIALNAGDWLFADKRNITCYKGTPRKWSKFITAYLNANKIDKIFVFGDCRFYQKSAIRAAEKLGISVFVFEEGYVRPDFITLELHGVNDNSRIPRQRSFYDKLPYVADTQIPSAKPMKNSLFRLIMSAITYYIAANLFWFLYPHYIHHRDFSVTKEAFWGLRNFARKITRTLFDKGVNKRLSGELSKRYFFVPLQTKTDFQIKKHSRFINLEGFLKETLISFAAHAPKDTFIVFKHHPIDRGKRDFTAPLMKLARKLGVEKRVIVVFELNIPNALKNALGTVTINSTVGLSSLYHGTPTITLGRAIYDIYSLTCKSVLLEDFWLSPTPPDMALFRKFRKFLIENSQINSSFYGKLGEMETL